MQPNAALAALNPTVADTVYDSTISDLPSFDPWEMGSGWIKPLAFDTPLNVRVSAKMFAQIQFHAAAEGEDEEEYIGNELIFYIDCLAKTREISRLKADPNFDKEAHYMSAAEMEEWLADDDDDGGCPDKEANLDDDVDDF